MIFESLFVQGLRADGAFAEALLAEGVDVRALKLEYPMRVLNRCVDLARQHLYPDLPEEAAQRHLGRVFVQGFTQTLLGRVVVVGMPMLGPVRYLKRFPDHLRLDSSPLRVLPVQVGERAFRMEFRNEALVRPDFLAGVLLEGLKLARAEAAITVERHSLLSFDLHITW
ncbi:DUF2378 family protein [Myxococcus sp. RHST-1-4]|nr:DUF2378 family protein [Myxococcus sp. RHSTA-1-4]